LSAARLFTGLSKHSNSVPRELFPALGLASMGDWDSDVHLPAYLTGAVLPAHSQTRRTAFWSYYSSMATHGRRWHEGLPVHQAANYARWALPRPDANSSGCAAHISKRAARRSAAAIGPVSQSRLPTTAAVTPYGVYRLAGG